MALVKWDTALFGAGVLVFDFAVSQPLLRSAATRLSQCRFRFGRACDVMCG